MPGHALLLAMDDIFRWIVNFFGQSFVRKVAVANFATIAERQIALPWRLRPYTPQTQPAAQEWADSLWADPEGSDPMHNTRRCVPEFRSRMRNILRTNRCAGTYPNLTPTPVPIFRRDTCGRYRHTPTSYTPDSRQCQPPTGDCADLVISENFVIFM